MTNKITHLKSASGYTNLSKHDVVKYIRKAATQEIKFNYTDHAKQRMIQREISTTDLLNVFETGQPETNPFFAMEHGTWECNILGRSAGRQIRLGIAIQLMDPDSKTYIMVITAIDLDN